MHDPVSPISQSRSISSGTSKAPSTMVCFFAALLRQTSSPTLMLTGAVVPTPTNPLRATRCSWATTLSPGLQSVRTSSPVRALRRSTASWPTVCQSLAGFVSCFWSCIAPCRRPLWSIVITSASSTSQPTLSSTSAPSMLRSIFTLSESALPSETFMSSTSQGLLSLPTSSQRGCPLQCSQSFDPISNLQWLEFRLWGC
jgi:hypothetical protein